MNAKNARTVMPINGRRKKSHKSDLFGAQQDEPVGQHGRRTYLTSRYALRSIVIRNASSMNRTNKQRYRRQARVSFLHHNARPNDCVGHRVVVAVVIVGGRCCRRISARCHCRRRRRRRRRDCRVRHSLRW